MKNTETILRKFAQISKSIYGESYSVEYYIGNTIYHEHFDSLMDAKRFCARNSMNFKVNIY